MFTHYYMITIYKVKYLLYKVRINHVCSTTAFYSRHLLILSVQQWSPLFFLVVVSSFTLGNSFLLTECILNVSQGLLTLLAKRCMIESKLNWFSLLWEFWVFRKDEKWGRVPSKLVFRKDSQFQLLRTLGPFWFLLFQKKVSSAFAADL